MSKEYFWEVTFPDSGEQAEGGGFFSIGYAIKDARRWVGTSRRYCTSYLLRVYDGRPSGTMWDNLANKEVSLPNWVPPRLVFSKEEISEDIFSEYCDISSIFRKE